MSALSHSVAGARALPIDLLLSSIPSLPRQVLDRLVERAIDRLDEMDGDPDLEDDDPAGTFEDKGEPGSWIEGSDSSVQCIGDDDEEGDIEDRRLRVPHIKRLRRSRCDRLVDRWGYVTYQLLDNAR